jgi:hypothetical protein
MVHYARSAQVMHSILTKLQPPPFLMFTKDVEQDKHISQDIAINVNGSLLCIV